MVPACFVGLGCFVLFIWPDDAGTSCLIWLVGTILPAAVFRFGDNSEGSKELRFCANGISLLDSLPLGVLLITRPFIAVARECCSIKGF